jgi:hypothetical protein
MLDAQLFVVAAEAGVVAAPLGAFDIATTAAFAPAQSLISFARIAWAAATALARALWSAISAAFEEVKEACADAACWTACWRSLPEVAPGTATAQDPA